MPKDICPSLFYIFPDTNTPPYSDDDIFMPDRFRILQAENLTQIKEIVANTTGTDQTLQVRLLCCYRMKEHAQSYCTHRRVDKPKKQVCSIESGIRTNFIHFTMRMNKLPDTEYLLAFIENSDLHNNIQKLFVELSNSIEWLELKAKQICFNIFLYGEPIFGTLNTSQLDKELDIASEQVKRGQRNVNIEYTIRRINKTFRNSLSVCMKNNRLSFGVS